MQKDLSVLEHAVRIGRKTLTNTMKYIKITLSSNFGNILSIMVASVFLPFLPMLPLQLLILDLLYGTSCLALPFDSVSEDYLARAAGMVNQEHAEVHVLLWPTYQF